MVASYLIKPILNEIYPCIDYGEGIYLIDKNGKRYIDGASGAVTANIGHGVREILEAMSTQAEKVSFVYRSQFTSEVAEELAYKISMACSGDLNWSFFVNSGSEATETAMKIAIQHFQERGMTTKHKILSRWVSYHGITLGALSMSGHTLRRARFVPLLEDFPTIPPPYCYRCPYGLEPSTCDLPCAKELASAIQEIGADQIAAFIAEPIVGAAGAALTPPPGYYEIIREICTENDILFIADEVMTGFGRTGAMLASDHWGVVPDIVALGKGMGAGYTPIAATVVTDRVMEPILAGSKSIMSGHTLSANPLACATSLAVMSYLEKHHIVENLDFKAFYLFHHLKEMQKDFSFIGDVRGKGLLIGVEFVASKATKQPFPREYMVTQMIVKLATDMGLLVYPSAAGIDGVHGDAIILAPPLTITKPEMDSLLELLRQTFEAFQQTLLEREDSHEEPLSES